MQDQTATDNLEKPFLNDSSCHIRSENGKKSWGANAHLHAICKLRKWRSSENGENGHFYKLIEKTKKEI